MAQVIKPKRGTSTPTTGNIVDGEMAVDLSAQKLYVRDGGTIKEIGASSTGLSISVISTNTTATAGTHYHIDTSGVTLTLPASPSAGDEVGVSVDDFTDVVVARNGSNIAEAAEDLTMDVSELYVLLRYVDATQGWMIVQSSLTANTASIGLSVNSTVQTANFNAANGQFYIVNTASGAVTATLPASPTAGDFIGFADYGGDWGTNNLTIGRNGENILADASDFVIDVNWTTIKLYYVDSTSGWIRVE